MGKFKFFSLLIAAGMFAACSDNLDDGGGNSEMNTSNATEGYVRVSINTPTTNGNMSRADDDQDSAHDIDLEDGIANEYQINNGVIVFFKTTSDDSDPDTDATFVSAYSLTGLESQDDNSAQVTNKVVTVSEAPMIDSSSEALYALVILNTPSTIAVDANTHGLTLNSTPLTAGTSTLSEFTAALENQDIENYIGNAKNAFTMCNAPLSTIAGAEGMVAANAAAKTLVPVTVYKTKTEAESNDAALIYVERVVAKVTLTGFTYEGLSGEYKINVKDDGGVYSGDVVKLDGWILNVTNKSTKLVRDVSGYNASGWLANATSPATNKIVRFAGKEVIPVDHDGTTNYYRIYWAEDGNYTSDDTDSGTDFLTYYTGEDGTITPSDPEPGWNPDTSDKTSEDNDYALYCFENTMNYNCQNQGSTTAVLLKTTYMTKFGNQEAATAQNFFICGASPVKYPEADDIQATGGSGYVEDIITHVITEANNVLAEGSKIDPSDLSVKAGAPAGIYDSKDKLKQLFTLNNPGSDDTKWIAIWNQIGTVRYYKEGTNYYYASRIRHFYDDETTWSDGETYGIQHLGRYGVVRNNWYEIKVNSISGPGEPGIVKPDVSEPDDKTEGYIYAQINVLSWAKRTHGVDL